MKKEMLINVLQPEECRIAIVEDGVLEELYVERTSLESFTGNIYKGKIVNLEPAIQAAFVDFSVGRNGFLHVSDVEPQYYRRLDDDAPAPPPSREPRRDREAEDRLAGRVEERPPYGTPLPEERPREERPRDDRPRGDRPRGRDRDRDRPDRSDRRRPDRSEVRRFGEGLVDDEWTPTARALQPPPPPPPPQAPAPAPVAPPEPVFEPEPEQPAAFEEPEPIPSWSRGAPRSRTPQGRETRPAPTPPPAPEREREREPQVPARGRSPRPPKPLEADLPPSRTNRREAEPSEVNLPPSRTNRNRPEPPAPTPPPASRAIDPEIEEMLRPRATRGETPFTPEARDQAELPPSSREPRRARGRGRGRSTPEPEAEVRLPQEFEGPAEPAFEELDRPEPREPRRRGGRDAIRSRGGEREPLPERTRPAGLPSSIDRIEAAPAGIEPVRARAPEPERPRAAEPERPRSAEPERPRERERGRERGDRDREAGRKLSDRAGEPGYVPRSMRSSTSPSRPPEPAFEQAPPPPFGGWPEQDVELPEGSALEGDDDREGSDEAGDRGEAGRRRRRRRGRRRERPRDERETPVTARAGDEDADLDLDADDDLGEGIEPALARGATPSPDDFEFDDDLPLDDEDDELLDDEIDPDVAAVASPDDEIDPELEEEIRREIEEIAELELEMGLRGTVEARPRGGDRGAPGPGGRPSPRGRSGGDKPPLQDIFRRGDEVLVQVIKESIGTKGPTLSTYISIPGRYLVLMPGLNRVGVSRKIADEGQRRKLREIMTELNPPKGLGFIVRTAGLDRTKRELARDLAYLLRLWKVILRRIKKARTPAVIYQESDMITRTIRDIFNSEIDTIWIDEPAAFERAHEFLRVVMPRYANRLKLYTDKVPLFHKYGIEEEIAKIQRRVVPLPEGGSIVIDPTEALVAIDVNSGNFRVENDAERTAYEMNLRAAKEIARQLRLRDLGGVICNDFIDMRDERSRRGVERALRDAIKRDRARTKIARISPFGIIEMTRQRIRPSLKRSVYEDCGHCSGAGVVKTVESMSIDVMRLLALASQRQDIRRINITVNPEVSTYLNNRKRKEINTLESDGDMLIFIRPQEDSPAEFLQIDSYDADNAEIRLLPAPQPPARRGR